SIAALASRQPSDFGNVLYGILAWTVEVGTDARLKVGVIQGGAMIWRKVGDESWADGPGRMKLGVPCSQSPSGWMMEVKPGDDTTGARTMHLDINGGDEAAAVRFIPAEYGAKPARGSVGSSHPHAPTSPQH